MSSLKDSANKRLKNINRRPDLPPWWRLFQYGCLVLIAGWMGYKLIAPTPPATVVHFATPVETSTASPSATATATSSASPESTSPPTATVTVPNSTTGAAVSVPQAALAQAQLDVKALYTINYTNVNFYPGESAPAASSIWPNVQVGTPSVLSSDATSVMFVFPVDADGPGPYPLRQVAIKVVNTPTGWAWKQGS